MKSLAEPADFTGKGDEKASRLATRELASRCAHYAGEALFYRTAARSMRGADAVPYRELSGYGAGRIFVAFLGKKSAGFAGDFFKLIRAKVGFYF